MIKNSTQYFVCFPDIEEIDFNLSSEVPKQIILQQVILKI